MKKWDLALLLALLVTILLGVAFGNTADTQPNEQVYAWWGIMYPDIAGYTTADGNTVEIRWLTAELWQKLCKNFKR